MTLDVVFANATYKFNKTAKVESVLNCPSCKNLMVKNTYQKTFCSIKCKDLYWNVTKYRLRFNKKFKKNKKVDPNRIIEEHELFF